MVCIAKKKHGLSEYAGYTIDPDAVLYDCRIGKFHPPLATFIERDAVAADPGQTSLYPYPVEPTSNRRE